jgi:hypothetical protein
MLLNIWRGDDDRNPKKILERQHYLFPSLLACQFRLLREKAILARLQPTIELQNMSDQQKVSRREFHKQLTTAELAELYEQAIEKLDTEQALDSKSNVDLRLLLQNSFLHPQLEEIIPTFQHVDSTLQLPLVNQNFKNAVNTTPSSDIRHPFSEMTDWTLFVDILKDEYRELCQSIVGENTDLAKEQNPTTQNSVQFLLLKKEAIATLLLHHGEIPAGYPSALQPTATAGDPAGVRDGLDAFGVNTSRFPDDRLQTIRNYQTVNMVRSILLRREVGFSVVCLRSLIQENGGASIGRGVFLDGRAMSGSIIAFQPGDVWPKEHLLTTAPEVMAHFEGDNDDDLLLSLRFDDHLLDARKSPVSMLHGLDVACNPWALGHMINHPPAGVLPNCQSTMINYTEKLLGRIRRETRGPDSGPSTPVEVYIPNVFAREPTWRSRYFDIEPVVMYGQCLLARRDIHNEELFYDYRLQTHDTPEWYHIVKYDNELIDQHDQVVFFRDDWKNNRD